MTPRLLLASATLAAATSLPAALITYTDLAATSNGQAVSVAFDASHQFLDPDSGTPAAGAMYYGGSISFPTNDWGIQGGLYLTQAGVASAENAYGLRFYVNEGPGSQVHARSNAAQQQDSLGAGPLTLDVVIKLTDLVWNTAQADVFLGANANNATEGTPDFSIQVNNLTGANPLAGFEIRKDQWNPVGGFSATRLFSATEWTPLSSVPEPTTTALGAGAAALAIAAALRRRR